MLAKWDKMTKQKISSFFWIESIGPKKQSNKNIKKKKNRAYLVYIIGFGWIRILVDNRIKHFGGFLTLKSIIYKENI